MKLIFLLFVGIVLYFIARNYKTEKFENIKLDNKEHFDGDLMHHEVGLLVALMAKVSKADGKVCELEAQMLKHTFEDLASYFTNKEEIKNKLIAIYKIEKENFANTIVLAKNLYSITKYDYQKRIKVLEYLLNLAFIDKDFSNEEEMITKDISNALKIKNIDFENLTTVFKDFYNNQKESSALSLNKAYEILNVSSKDDDSIIKKAYRTLVKKYHPDIITGQGAKQNIIDNATRKLQEINEAYELIKKDRKR